MPATFTGEILKQINDELSKRANNALKKDDLTFSQAGVIITLGKNKGAGMSIKDLSKAMCVAQPTTTGIVERLKEKDLVFSGSDSEDKRVRIIQLTEKGRGCLANATKNKKLAEKQFLEGLTADEQEQLIGLLEKVKNNLVK